MGSEGQRAWKDAPSKQDHQRLIEATKDGKEKLIIHLLGTVGLRDGEVAALTKSCLQEDGFLDVPGTKTRASRRIIPIQRFFPDVWLNLGRYFQLHPKMIPGTSEGIRVLVRRVGDRLGLDVYPHALRGRAAYDMGRILKGDSHKLSAWMGWKTVASADAYIQTSEAIWFDEEGR